MAYEALAASYDRLTNDIPYEAVLAFYRQILAQYGAAPATAVDLACGTGSMALLLAGQGMSVIGVDQSEEMLTVAYEKAMELENPPYFVRQKLQSLRLPQPVELAVCCLDGVNYVTEPAQLQAAFARVYRALTPGGVFIFDVVTEAKLSGLDGQIFVDEDDDVFCLWRASYDQAARLCRYGMDLFRRQGRAWIRSAEEHLEHAYRAEELTQWLGQAGFDRIRVYADRRLAPPAPDEQRIFFAAQRPQAQNPQNPKGRA